jgi:hypothetical protein
VSNGVHLFYCRKCRRYVCQEYCGSKDLHMCHSCAYEEREKREARDAQDH